MAAPEATRPISQGKGGTDSQVWLERLPGYGRSLLKIQVPVTVTLATNKRPIGAILELVPGSILQFDKGCDAPLSLEIGNLRVAEGETVKVGDRFGLRLTSMVLPEERFRPVQGRPQPAATPGVPGAPPIAPGA
ncbi:MAG: FliM/FliN family flagellar motor C-terminal domain-containing protein [Pirellulaceae bacterium]|jgi:flagellar motor switch protein FliM|nr:FliM/FliN family flagellar motor C-terminal domain-containing protein [Pirellulaceae bacterium]